MCQNSLIIWLDCLWETSLLVSVVAVLVQNLLHCGKIAAKALRYVKTWQMFPFRASASKKQQIWLREQASETSERGEWHAYIGNRPRIAEYGLGCD